MKFYPKTAAAIIVNYFLLFTLLWFASHILSSESKDTNIIPESEQIIVSELQHYQQNLQYPTNTFGEIENKILFLEQNLQPFNNESINNTIPLQNLSHNFINRPILFKQTKEDLLLLQEKLLPLPLPNKLTLRKAINTNILSMIFNQFLNIQDILCLRGSCKEFQILLRSNPHDMVTICNNVGFKEFHEVPLIWFDLKYFLDQSYATIFYKLEMFNIRQNEYALLTSQNKIICWHNELTNYLKILLNNKTKEILQNEQLGYKFLLPTDNNSKLPIHNKGKSAFANITKEGNVVTFGDEDYGGDSNHVQLQLKKVKMIVATECSFAALLDSGNVIAWGFEYYGGKIPDEIQIQLCKVKMIFSSDCAFAALLDSGHVIAWGHTCGGGEIPEEIQIQLEDIKMITSTNSAFAALSHNGNVYVWGDEDSGGEIPDEIQDGQLKNIKMIFSNDVSFAALSNDGHVIAWGEVDYGGLIPAKIQTELQNVKMIFSTESAFAALLENGTVVAWGDEENGGIIPHEIQNELHQVKILCSTEGAFVALLENGNVFAWGNEKFGGKISVKIQQKLKNNVKMIFQTEGIGFFALCNDGSTIDWN